MTGLVKGNNLFIKKYGHIKQYPYLNTDVSTEVAVIGGGITGAIVSYYLSKATIPHVVIEKSRVGYGSSSITTALIQYELDSNCEDLLPYTTKERITRSYFLCNEAIKDLVDISKTVDNFDYIVCDSVLYSHKEEDIRPISTEYHFRHNLGFPVQYLNTENNPYPFSIKAGILSHQTGGTLNPYKAAHAMLKYSVEKGNAVYENSEVTHIEHHEDHEIITTLYDYKVTAKKVIIATGYDLEPFTKMNLGHTLSTSFNIVTAPIVDLPERLTRTIFRDNETVYHYLRPTPDKRLIFGGEDIGFNPYIDNEKLCEKHYDILEGRLRALLSDYSIDIECAYCGAFATTPDNLGFIGPDPKHQNQWYCLGYGADGILFAIIGAKMLVKLYHGETDPDMTLFKVGRYLG